MWKCVILQNFKEIQKKFANTLNTLFWKLKSIFNLISLCFQGGSRSYENLKLDIKPFFKVSSVRKF